MNGKKINARQLGELFRELQTVGADMLTDVNADGKAYPYKVSIYFEKGGGLYSLNIEADPITDEHGGTLDDNLRVTIEEIPIA